MSHLVDLTLIAHADLAEIVKALHVGVDEFLAEPQFSVLSQNQLEPRVQLQAGRTDVRACVVVVVLKQL